MKQLKRYEREAIKMGEVKTTVLGNEKSDSDLLQITQMLNKGNE